jgi:hypothetical protein
VFWEEVSAKGSTRWTYKALRLPTELVEDTQYNLSDERLQAEEQNNYIVFYLIELKIMKNTL